MKNKKLLCIIAILLIVSCALSIVLTACGETKNNGNSNGNTDNNNDNNSGTVDQKPFDFDSMTEEDWKSDKVSEKEWKKAFDASNFENFTCSIRMEDEDGIYGTERRFTKNGISVKEYEYDEEEYYDMIILLKKNSVVEYYQGSMVDYNEEDEGLSNLENKIQWYKMEFGIKDQPFVSFEEIVKKDKESCFDFSKIKDNYSEATYKDGTYQLYGYKVIFKNGKLSMISFADDDSIAVAYHNYGTTKITTPTDYHNVSDCKKEHNDEDNDGRCNNCFKCIRHVDEDNDSRCDNCYECMSHIDEDNDSRCDNCYECLGHVDEDKSGYCDICMEQLF